MALTRIVLYHTEHRTQTEGQQGSSRRLSAKNGRGGGGGVRWRESSAANLMAAQGVVCSRRRKSICWRNEKHTRRGL